MLEMMYVYFDMNGDIKTISPDPVDLFGDYTATTAPLTEVEDFLLGKKNPFDYYVKVTKGIASSSYKITKKQALEATSIRTLDNFLTEVKTISKSANAFVLIENIIEEKKIKISLNSIVKVLLEEGTDKDHEIILSFISHPPAPLYFTRKDDPYFLLHTVIFSPRELYDSGELFYEYSIDLSNSSVYTKKIYNGYSYKVI